MTTPDTIPAISLWQPWASLLAEGYKSHETRSFQLKMRVHGRRVAIHAAKKRVPLYLFGTALDRRCVELWGHGWDERLDHGAIVGSCIFSSFQSTDEEGWLDEDDLLFGDWSPGRYAWLAQDVRCFVHGIPFPGRQSWFPVPISILPPGAF